jgi:deoxyribodipyrimidine photo-lyase
VTTSARWLDNPRVTVRRADPVTAEGKCVVYWMQRAQRGRDNPALDVAIEVANELQRPVAVFFGLHPKYPNANLRHYAFLLEGLPETKETIEARGAAFVFRPYPAHDLLRFCAEVKPCLVIGDENPLRAPEQWRQSAARQLRTPFWTVDADVIVPSKLFPQEEYAARTIRPKLQRLLPVFLQATDNPSAHYRWPKPPPSQEIAAAPLLAALPLDRSAAPVSAFRGGTTEGLRLLQRFISERLAAYATDRNQPQRAGTSELSAYLHFGQLGPLTIALAVQKAEAPPPAKQAYMEELIVRRELAINYVVRNPDYDRLTGCPQWAQTTLAEHLGDERPHLYTEAQFEAAATHDPLWNAAQMEMVNTGRMHGYLRMYWAKKLLEWTRTPEEAFALAIKFNDRYFLDGRDPNGYTGIAWAIGGKHDRPWGPRRPVFGLIRYMSAAGCARKFDVKAYIARVNKQAGTEKAGLTVKADSN